MSLWSAFLGWFNPLLAKLKDFLKAIFQGALEIALAKLREIAVEVVKEIQNDPSIITNEDRRKEAFKRIAAYAKAQGIVAGDSIINLAIELAVAFLKTKE